MLSLHKLKQGELSKSLGLMLRYELILECRKLGIQHYSHCNKQQLIKKIEDFKLNQIKLVFQSCDTILNQDCLQIILSYVNVRDDINVMRTREICRSRRLYRKIGLVPEKKWFWLPAYRGSLVRSLLKQKQQTYLRYFYRYEIEKIQLLSQTKAEIAQSSQKIMRWRRYLHFYDLQFPSLAEQFRKEFKVLEEIDPEI